MSDFFLGAFVGAMIVSELVNIFFSIKNGRNNNK